jgi:MoaA/NifB/PqqE/SkfB family radical SAM enzyme
MNYNIEADWQLLDTCNYRCDYCFFGPETLGSKLRTFASPEGWKSAFDATGDVWLLHMTGGEPSIYPDFVELCENLTARHFVSINSNLTHCSLQNFARRIDPSRISFINAGLHLEERELRNGHHSFLSNADLLRSSNFPILVSLVATPTALERFPEAIALMKPVGLFPIPKLFRGTLGGRSYPEAYTDGDKRRFKTFAEQARDFYQPLIAKMDDPPSIDALNDDLFLEGLPSYRGLLCDAGDRFVQILPNGDVFRCGGSSSQGNILNGTLVRRSKPAPCDTQHCYYFCNKYSQPAVAPGLLARP